MDHYPRDLKKSCSLISVEVVSRDSRQDCLLLAKTNGPHLWFRIQSLSKVTLDYLREDYNARLGIVGSMTLDCFALGSASRPPIERTTIQVIKQDAACKGGMVVIRIHSVFPVTGDDPRPLQNGNVCWNLIQRLEPNLEQENGFLCVSDDVCHAFWIVC